MTELEYSEFLKAETDLEREASILALEHHGVKGQKWGVHRTPEQLGHKKKKKKTGILSKFTKSAKKKAASAKKATEKKKEESKEEIRKKLLTSTDPKYIYKNIKLLDDKELQNRIDRISKERKMKELIPDPSEKTKKQLKTGEEYLKSLAGMAESIEKVYKAYNTITGNSSGGNQKKDENKDNNQQNQQSGKKKKKK